MCCLFFFQLLDEIFFSAKQQLNCERYNKEYSFQHHIFEKDLGSPLEWLQPSLHKCKAVPLKISLLPQPNFLTHIFWLRKLCGQGFMGFWFLAEKWTGLSDIPVLRTRNTHVQYCTCICFSQLNSLVVDARALPLLIITDI
jgi:hypothetical protein